MNYQNIIFDWSGTLCNDFRHSYRATRETLLTFGGPRLTLRDYREHFTLPVRDFYKKYLKGVSAREIDLFYFQHFKPFAAKSGLYRGTKGLLKALQTRGLRLFLFSTVRQDLLEGLCERLGIIEFFDRVVGSVWDKERELPAFCRKLKMKKSNALFIGDMEHDLKAAKKAGIAGGAVLYGYHAPERLIGLKPDFAWKTPAELARFFKIRS